jgi:integrase
MTKRNDHGTGSVQERGNDTFRLRYRVDGKRFEKTFHGTKTDARKELRRLLKSGDDGDHVEPNKLTVGQWIDQWLQIGAPGRRRKKVSERTLERYSQLLRTHVKPALGNRPLQQLKPVEIDKLYSRLESNATIAPRTQHHVHTVFSALLATAARKGMIAANPMVRISVVPNPEGLISDDDMVEESDYGDGLSEAELTALIAGFKSSGIYPVVALAAATGARRNELLALRWSDLDTEAKTLKIERALEQTKKFGLRVKPPKTKRGLRTISLDDATIAMLVELKKKHLRWQRGLPDAADVGAVDLSLVLLPEEALMFPTPSAPGKAFAPLAPRHPRNFSKEFRRHCRLIAEQAKLSGKKADEIIDEETRFHVLRGVHATALLDAGIPVHTVAQRIGDDPATLLKVYTKRKRTLKADKSLSNAIAELAAGFLKS